MLQMITEDFSLSWQPDLHSISIIRASKVKNFAMAMRARKVCPDVMVPNSNVTQIVDIFWLVCQTE